MRILAGACLQATHAGGCADVAAPSDFELPYENLELKTPDEVVLRCYLLPQRKDAGAGEAFLDIPAGMSEDEVRGYLGLSDAC